MYYFYFFVLIVRLQQEDKEITKQIKITEKKTKHCDILYKMFKKKVIKKSNVDIVFDKEKKSDLAQEEQNSQDNEVNESKNINNLENHSNDKDNYGNDSSASEHEDD